MADSQTGGSQSDEVMTIDPNKSYKVVVDGKEQEVTGNQFLNGYNRGVGASEYESRAQKAESEIENLRQETTDLKTRDAERTKELEILQSSKKEAENAEIRRGFRDLLASNDDPAADPFAVPSDNDETESASRSRGDAADLLIERLTGDQSSSLNAEDVATIVDDRLNNFAVRQEQKRKIETEFEKQDQEVSQKLVDTFKIDKSQAQDMVNRVRDVMDISSTVAVEGSDPVAVRASAWEAMINEVIPEMTKAAGSSETERINAEHETEFLSAGGDSQETTGIDDWHKEIRDNPDPEDSTGYKRNLEKVKEEGGKRYRARQALGS